MAKNKKCRRQPPSPVFLPISASGLAVVFLLIITCPSSKDSIMFARANPAEPDPAAALGEEYVLNSQEYIEGQSQIYGLRAEDGKTINYGHMKHVEVGPQEYIYPYRGCGGLCGYSMTGCYDGCYCLGIICAPSIFGSAGGYPQ